MKRKLIAVVTTALLAGFGTFGYALSASADDVVTPTDTPTAVSSDAPVDPDATTDSSDADAPALRIAAPAAIAAPAPAYNLAAWYVPGGLGSIWTPPQTIVTNVLQDTTLDLNALDTFDFVKAVDPAGALCGVNLDFQIDGYLNDATTDALIAGGILYGPSNPTEHLATGAVAGDPWKYLTVATPACPTIQTCTTTGTKTFTVNDLALGESRFNGHTEFTSAGLHVYTDSATDDNDANGVANSPAKYPGYSDKAAGYLAVDFALKDLGDFGINWTGTGLKPGGQLVVDLNNDGTDDGILIQEDVYGAGNLWGSGSIVASPLSATLPHHGGGGSAVFGSTNEYLAAYPNARVHAIGYSLGSGAFGDGIIASITANCFAYTAVAVPTPPVTPPTQPTLAATGATTAAPVITLLVLLQIGLSLLALNMVLRRRSVTN